MRNLPAPVPPSTVPHQLSMPFDSGRFRGMSASERRTVLARLATLLSEAAGGAVGERDNDER